MDSAEPLSYERYLRLDELLALQEPRSRPAAHDELQFIIVHQVYELWFKLLLHEAKSTIAHLQAGRVEEAIWLLRRMIETQRVMTQQVSVLETMSPANFLEFRDLLQPASGLQSLQFRELEFFSGLRDERFVELFEEPAQRRRLDEALRGPSLWTAFCDLLASRGFPVGGPEEQVAAIVRIYSEPGHRELHQLCEAMVEYDEQFRVWRWRHGLMAERMIGRKPGTGATQTARLVGRASFQEPGVRYLQSRMELRFFPALWEARTRMGAGR